MFEVIANGIRKDLYLQICKSYSNYLINFGLFDY